MLERREKEKKGFRKKKCNNCNSGPNHLFSLELSIVSVAKNVSIVETFISLQTVV